MKTAALPALLLSAALAAPAAFGQQTAGGEAFEFLLLEDGARAAALGGAYTALATGADALRYNPAGLALTRRFEATAAHDQYFQGAIHEYFAMSAPAGWAANLNYLNFGNITRTTLSQHAGAGGSVGLSDAAVSAGYGRTVLDSPELGTAGVGLGVKYLHESLDNIGANGLAADAGALFFHPAAPGLTLGLSALNFGPDVSFSSKREKLPVDLHAGLAFAFTSPGGLDNTLTLEALKARSDKTNAAFGLEVVVQKLVALRLGYTSRNSAQRGVTGGVGFSWKAWSVDYAAAAYGELGLTNTLSLTYRWGEEQNAGPRRVRQNPFVDNLLPRFSAKRKTAAVEEPVSGSKSAREAPTSALPPAAFLPAAASDQEEHFALARRFIEDRAYAQAKKELALAAPFGGPERRLMIYYETLGVVALDEDDMEKAQKSGAGLAGELGLKPSPADPYAGAGFCMLLQKDKAYAVRFFEKALDSNPSQKTKAWIEARLEELKASRP